MRRLFLLVALVAVPALAQRGAPRGPSSPQAAERYHDAARLYVDGQNAPALAAAEEAVALAPTDARAVALRDLLKKKQDDQDQQNQDQEPPPDDDQNDDDEQNDGGQEPPENDPQAPSDRPGEQPEQDGAGQTPRMSAEQAERLLDAVGGDERMLLRQMRRPPSRVRTNEQDW